MKQKLKQYAVFGQTESAKEENSCSQVQEVISSYTNIDLISIGIYFERWFEGGFASPIPSSQMESNNINCKYMLKFASNVVQKLCDLLGDSLKDHIGWRGEVTTKRLHNVLMLP